MKSQQQKDFEKIKGDWEQVGNDLSAAFDTMADTARSAKAIINTAFNFYDLYLEETKQSALLREKEERRQAEILNLWIKQYTLGLTYAEKKRLHDRRQETL